MMTYEFCLHFCIIFKNFKENFQFKLIRSLIENWFWGTSCDSWQHEFHCLLLRKSETKTIFRKNRFSDEFSDWWSFSRYYVVFFHKVFWHLTVLVPDANEGICFEKTVHEYLEDVFPEGLIERNLLKTKRKKCAS